MDFKETDTNGNFKLNQYHQNYGYDLEAALGKLPIKELETPKYKEDLMESLKKGNLQSATFLKDGRKKGRRFPLNRIVRNEGQVSIVKSLTYLRKKKEQKSSLIQYDK